ncbi:MAG: hypothetical protein V4719_12010 [Planctomycetota bacterium]
MRDVLLLRLAGDSKNWSDKQAIMAAAEPFHDALKSFQTVA